jgi:hypothetical protein
VAKASKIAVADVKAFFAASPEKIFWPSELRDVCIGQRHAWKIPRGMNFSSILDLLIRNTQLKELKLKCADYPPLTRYTWGDISPVLLALSHEQANLSIPRVGAVDTRIGGELPHLVRKSRTGAKTA